MLLGQPHLDRQCSLSSTHPQPSGGADVDDLGARVLFGFEFKLIMDCALEAVEGCDQTSCCGIVSEVKLVGGMDGRKDGCVR